MISDITLGQYFAGNSVLHRLDPRTKIISSILYIVAIFMAKNIFCYALIFAGTLLLVALSGIPLRMILKGLKPIVFILIFTMILNIFWTSGDSEPLVSFWRIKIYWEGILRAVFMALRVIFLIIATSVFLTYTTSPISLTDAIESLLGPLKKIRVPVHEFAMMMTIALRFIPTLVEETEKIMNAQKARGADFTSGSLIRRAKALIPILIPLFVSAFQRAFDLANAMECRCYRGGKGRTKLVKLQYRVRDVVAFLLVAVFLAAIIAGNRVLAALGIGFTV